MDISAKQTELSNPKKITFAEVYIQTGSKWKATLAVGEDLFEDLETVDLIREMRKSLKEKAVIYFICNRTIDAVWAIYICSATLIHHICGNRYKYTRAS